MKAEAQALLVGLLLPMTSWSSTAAVAQSPTDFSFGPGQTCWRFAGVAGRFSGDLDKGDKVVVTATGEKTHAKGGHVWVTTGERDVEVISPDPDADLDLADDGGLTVPKAGRYTFAIDPITDAGTAGVFVICKR